MNVNFFLSAVLGSGHKCNYSHNVVSMVLLKTSIQEIILVIPTSSLQLLKVVILYIVQRKSESV